MSEGQTSEVRIGKGEFELVFTGPPFAEFISARVEGPFLNVGDSIVLDDTLLHFFAELHQSWRGWTGAKTWTAAGGNLTLSAHHDGVGSVSIAAAFRSPGLPDGEAPQLAGDWAASAVVAIEAGAFGPVETSLRAVYKTGLA
jgi:hypothetical protein